MHPTSIVELSDVAWKPVVKMSLPSPLRVGDKVDLRFRLSSQHGGRSEILDVDGDFQIRSVRFDASSGVTHQSISVSAVGDSPTWKAVRNGSAAPRKLSPAKAGPQPID